MEPQIIFDKHLLLCNVSNNINEIKYLMNNFCGKSYNNFNNIDCEPSSIIYLCGNIEQLYDHVKNLEYCYVYAIEQYSENFIDDIPIIHIDQVPIYIKGIGIYFRKFFNDIDYFNNVCNEHKVCDKGIHLSNVERCEDEIWFNILRSFASLQGPTDNFRNIDNEILNKLNDIVKHYFTNNVHFNHVSAKIYSNSNNKASSDITHDMPDNFLIAFCTFYNNEPLKLSNIKFKLKSNDNDNKSSIVKYLTLYHNSLLFITPEANRNWARKTVCENDIEILEYVVKCSNRYAVYKNDKVNMYNEIDDNLMELVPVSDDNEIKKLYHMENTTNDKIVYPSDIYFSFNKGDYLKPNL